MAKLIITLDRLNQVLNCNPETGLFTWKISPQQRVAVGSAAGSQRNSGYFAIGIDNKLYLAHRLVWLYVHGVMPKDQIDHINGIRNDNRIANLREANTAQNGQNSKLRSDSTTGRVGISWSKQKSKWAARICVEGARKHLGFFMTIEDAYEARLLSQAEHHPFQPTPRRS